MENNFSHYYTNKQQLGEDANMFSVGDVVYFKTSELNEFTLDIVKDLLGKKLYILAIFTQKQPNKLGFNITKNNKIYYRIGTSGYDRFTVTANVITKKINESPRIVNKQQIVSWSDMINVWLPDDLRNKYH